MGQRGTCHDWASKTVYAFQARRCNSASRSYSPPPAGPSGSDALSYKGSLQGSPSQTHSFLGSAAGCPSPLQGDPLLLFPKNSSKTRAGTKRKRAKGPFFLRLSKKRLCHFFEKAAACRARDWSAASGQTPHLQPEKCFPRRTCRRRKQITTGFAPAGANSARLFPLSLFLLLLGLKALKSL